MADIDHYRTCIETLIKQHGRLSSTEEVLETQWIFDREHHHYYLGWRGNARICGPVLHFDITRYSSFYSKILPIGSGVQ